MAGIFINYRRDDSPGMAGRLYDRIVHKFSRRDLFMDVDAMKPGIDFTKQLEDHVAQCQVLIAVIGPHWLDIKDQSGARRLDNEQDYVRIEIASALKRNIPVIPVLVDGAAMPKEASLPVDLKPLVRRQALELRYTRFDADAETIVHALEDLVPRHRLPWRLVGAGAAVLVIVAAVAMLWPKILPRPEPKTPAAGKTTTITSNVPAATIRPETPGVPATPSAPAAAPPAYATQSRNAIPVDGGMPINFGDTYDKISAAYQTYQQPEPSPWDKTTTWLYLKDLGIEFFFDASNKVDAIHFVPPWAGSIKGAKLGETAEEIKGVLGPPAAVDERFGGATTALIYRWPYTVTVEFHIESASGKVGIIMLD